MLEKYMGDSEAVARFTREALAASRIGNPHIIDVMDIGTAPDGRSYVVMELLAGSPLSKVIEDHGQMPPQRAINIMRQVLKGIGAAHAKGIVHRDLKPDNIFLLDHGDSGDFVKLLDFGISKMIDPDLQVAATKLTTTGVVMGTPLYMAPEQAMGAEIDHLADLYACGVIMYELLAGKPPFDGATYAVLVAKLLTSEPQLLSEIRPGLSPKLVAAVHRVLEKDPQARFPSAEAFSQALPQLTSASAMELASTQHSGKRAIQRRPTSSKGKRWPLFAASLAMLAGVGTATAIIIASNKSSTSSTPTTEQVDPPKVDPPVTPSSGLLTIHSIPPGAVITVDGKPFAHGSTMAVELGKHKIHAELIGYHPMDVEEEVVQGVKSSVPLRLSPINVTSNTPPPKTGPAPKIGPAPKTGTAPKTGPKTKPLTPAEMDALTKAALPSEDPAKVPPPPPPIKRTDPPKTPVTGPDTKPNPY
jgi:serine/threonine-protein kinase